MQYTCQLYKQTEYFLIYCEIRLKFGEYNNFYIKRQEKSDFLLGNFDPSVFMTHILGKFYSLIHV